MPKKIDYFERWEDNKDTVGTDNNIKFNLELVDNISPLKSIDKKTTITSRTKSDILRRLEIKAVKNELRLLRTGERMPRESDTSGIHIKHRRAQLIHVRDVLSEF